MSQHCVQVDDKSFDNMVMKSSTPVLLDFWAPWCGPCVSIAPLLESLAEEYKGKLVVAKMNVDENPNVPAQFGVRSIPTLVVVKDGKVVETVIGAQPKAKMVDLIQRTLS